MISGYRLKPAIFLMAVIVAAGAAEASAGEPVQFTIESSKDEYVVNEPVRFKLKLKNISETEQRVLTDTGEGFLSLTRNIDYYITTPAGIEEKRYIPWDSDLIGGMGDYKGVPLAPGDSLVAYVYPFQSFLAGKVTREKVLKEKKRRYRTFNKPGTYKISIVYEATPEKFNNIYTREGGLRSNEITVNFREPGPIEKKMIDAMEHSLGADIYIYDRVEPEDAEIMSELIEKYPDNPLTRHLELRVANARYWEGKLEEAAEKFREVNRKYPDFRYHNVQLFLAMTYLKMGKKEKAIEAIDTAFRNDPECRELRSLNELKAEILYGKREGYRKWMKARVKGIDLFKKENSGIMKNPPEDLLPEAEKVLGEHFRTNPDSYKQTPYFNPEDDLMDFRLGDPYPAYHLDVRKVYRMEDTSDFKNALDFRSWNLPIYIGDEKNPRTIIRMKKYIDGKWYPGGGGSAQPIVEVREKYPGEEGYKYAHLVSRSDLREIFLIERDEEFEIYIPGQDSYKAGLFGLSKDSAGYYPAIPLDQLVGHIKSNWKYSGRGKGLN
ncbi:MAG: tetratricopeptide repeat protein [Candidatus Krumholzibacteriales bacterium]